MAAGLAVRAERLAPRGCSSDPPAISNEKRPPRFSGRHGQDRRAARGRPVAARDRLRASHWRAGAGRDPAIARSRRLRPAPPRLVPRASRPRHLHRRLPARVASGRCQGLSDGRGPRDQGTGRTHRALSGRELRLRIQLARRGRTEVATSDGPGPGLEFDRDQSVRHQRLHRLVPAGWRGAPARDEFRHRLGRDGGGLRRVLQPRARHQVERPAPRARLRFAAQRALLVPGQRDGRTVANRPAPGARVRPQSAGRRATDAGHRPQTSG